MIPLYRPVIHDAARAAADRVMSGRWTTLGPETEAFEAEFRDLTGAAHVVATNNCTSALELALAVLDLPKGALVATTPLTFVATGLAIVRAGCFPLYIDTDPRTGQMDMHCLSERLQAGAPIAAVLTVHYAGTTADMAALEDLQARHGFEIVEDCAHGPLITYTDADGTDRHVGSRHMGCFSFHTLKPLSCGDGGAVTVNDPERFRRLRSLRWYGAISTADREKQNRYSWDYGVEELGFKAYMNDITAAIARGQMPHLAGERAVRAGHWQRYCIGLDPDRFVPVPHAQGSSYYLAMFRLRCVEREALIAELSGRGVHSSVHYKPINGYPGLEGQGDTPRAQAFFDQIVSLPLHHNHTEDEIDRVIAEANEVARTEAADPGVAAPLAS